MKQIKTIAICNDSAKFDDEVNAALVEGWILTRRYAPRLSPTMPGFITANGEPVGVYYAELEKETPEKKPTKGSRIDKKTND